MQDFQKQNNSIKCVIFDLDDTLYDYQSLNNQALQIVFCAAAKQFGISKKDAQNAFDSARKSVKNHLKNHTSARNRILYMQKMLEILGKNALLYALQFYELYWGHFLANMSLKNGVLEIFENLKSKNVQIGICTDLNTQIQIQKINALGIAKLVDFLVSSEEAGVEKPDSVIFELCFKKVQSIDKSAQKNEILFIGDSFEKDFCGAQNFGFSAFWINDSNFRNLAGILDSEKSFANLKKG